MDDGLEIRISGIAEIQRALFQFNAKLGERVNQIAIRKGANYMLKEIKAAAPVKTGRLRRAIRVKTSKKNQLRKNGTVGVYISISPGKDREDMKGAWYGKFVESGYNLGSKQISLARALSTGRTTVDEHLSRLAAASVINQNRRGKKSRVRVRYRDTGQRRIEGQHFIENTFHQTAENALEIMVLAAEVSAEQLARQLNLNVART